jgi:hypothetical protein
MLLARWTATMGAGETKQFLILLIVVYGSCLNLVLDANYDVGTIVYWSCRLKSTRKKVSSQQKCTQLSPSSSTVLYLALERLVDSRQHDQYTIVPT